MIEAASHHLSLPMGIHAYGIPAIRLHGISMQHAKDVTQIVGSQPLQNLSLTLIPTRSIPATEVLASHSHALAVDVLAPGHDFPGRPLQLRRIEIAAENAWSGRRVDKPAIQAFQHLDLDPTVCHTRRNVRRMNFY